MIPHKDTVSLLCSSSKKILLAYNNIEKLSAVPTFPLWAFLEKPLEKPSLMTIQYYKIKDDRLLFPVDLIDGGNIIHTEIVFGKINRHDSEEIQVPEIKEKFPVTSRVFKTGNAVFENNSWKLYDEKWFKCSK
ncbi:MAG: hypothetical protein J5857_05685 [Treponema sp.]|nr:hypothetical protein [Treponema sp.]